MIKSLTITGRQIAGRLDSWTAILPRSMFLAFVQGDKTGYEKAFRDLHHLKALNLDTGSDGLKENPSKDSQAIQQILKWAPGIENVHIGDLYPHDSDFRPQSSALWSLSIATPLDHLRKLWLGYSQTTLEPLVQFLKAHRRTLEVVAFMTVHIVDGTWSAAISQLRVCTYEKLATLGLHFCVGKIDHTEVQDYVLRKTDIGPLLDTKGI